ncbi:alpha/beta hydrolase [Rossellomorea marisflavi]|uniref:alpha/beta hydrolase n=1 Tax=Rossellomorea marisflavi TaxID=189381 RepID=UPI00203AEADD|nr:alpha/beta hydrolase [Rossellomorea marisflavi]MCM2604455.1 alpha/beta hydrolase [Rossellomorea marisflavi]
MKHIYQKGTNENAPTLLLLHGTGGDERDLLPLADMIAPGASVLSVKGNVSENGMPRFFARLAEGVFDEEDLVFRTKELKDFIDNSAVEHGFNRDRVVALGYSNGANIAGSMVYHYEDVLAGAILFHAMVPRRGVDIPALENLPVFVGAGTRDPIIPKSETEELILHLKESGADVTEYWTNGGHELRIEEVDEAARWFQNHFVK